MPRSISFDVQPLRPTLVKPFHRPGWIYEEKVDGWRIAAYKSGQAVRLVSRKGIEHTARFPGLVAAIAELPVSPLVLDGEVAVYDERLVSRFDLLAEPDPETPTTAPVYMACDVLWAGRQDFRARPLSARRDALERLVEDSRSVFPVRRLGTNGRAAWDEVLSRELEGYVTKD